MDSNICCWDVDDSVAILVILVWALVIWLGIRVSLMGILQMWRGFYKFDLIWRGFQ